MWLSHRSPSVGNTVINIHCTLQFTVYEIRLIYKRILSQKKILIQSRFHFAFMAIRISRLHAQINWVNMLSERVSDWLLFNAKWANSATSLREQATFAFYLTNTLSDFIVLTHWNNSPRVDMSLHWDTLARFRAHHS